MFFGVDYYPEHSVFPYGGDEEHPEAAWERDAELMSKVGINVVRVGEFTWGICEPEEGKYDFQWVRRVMDVMGQYDIKVVLGTPTAAPPVWLTRKHPEILPVDERGLVKREGTRRAVCLSSDVYWDYSKRVVTAMAEALGDHPQLIAWQIDNSIGGNDSEFSFNDATREEMASLVGRPNIKPSNGLTNFFGAAFLGPKRSIRLTKSPCLCIHRPSTRRHCCSIGTVSAAIPWCSSSRCRRTFCMNIPPSP